MTPYNYKTHTMFMCLKKNCLIKLKQTGHLHCSDNKENCSVHTIHCYYANFHISFLLLLSWYLQNNYAVTQHTIQKHTSAKAKQATFVCTIPKSTTHSLYHTNHQTTFQNFQTYRMSHEHKFVISYFSYNVQLIYSVFTRIKKILNCLKHVTVVH